MEVRWFGNEMGKLRKIWDVGLDEVDVKFDFKDIGCKGKEMIRFVEEGLKKGVGYKGMKVMIVGNSGSGKRTLLEELMKRKK